MKPKTANGSQARSGSLIVNSCTAFLPKSLAVRTPYDILWLTARFECR